MDEALPGRLRGPESWKDDFVWYYEVEKGGIYDLKDLYMFQFQWFQKEKMSHWQDGGKYMEDFYLHRLRPDGVQENLMWWRMTRKYNDFVHYMCKMDWQNFGAKETEVLYNKKKVKAHKIGLVIRVWWWVQWDPYNKWEKSFLGRITKWFYLWLLNQEMEDHRDKCRELALRHENHLKQWFEMTTDIPMPRSWFPEEGFKYRKQPGKPEQFEEMPRKPDAQI